MTITDVQLTIVDKGNLKAIGSIIIDKCFVIKDIKVIKSPSTGDLFIGMPSKKAGEEFMDLAHPINKETHAMLKEDVLAKYRSLSH